MSGFIRRVAITLLIAAMTAGIVTPAPASDGKLVIPTTIVLSGPGAFTGEGWKAGAEMAIDEINRHGGVNGKKLALALIDTQGTPQGGIAAMRKLIQQDKAPFVLAAGTSTDVTAAVPLLQTTFKSTPIYISVASDPRITAKFSRNIFVATPPQQYIVGSLAELSTKKLTPNTLVLLSCDVAWCIANRPLLIGEFSRRGVRVVKTLTYNAGDTDFSAQIRELSELNPDAVFVDGFPPDGGRILKALAQAGFKGHRIGMVTLSSNIVLSLAGAGAEGLFTGTMASSQHIESESDPMKSWREAFMKFMPNAGKSMLSLYTMDGYTDIYVLAEALRRAGPDASADKLIAALESLKDFVAGKDGYWTWAHPVSTPRTFTASDHVGSKTISPVVVANGKFVEP